MTIEPGTEVFAGIDLGLRSDSSALVVAHKYQGIVTIEEIVELRPQDDEPLKPSEVMAQFTAAMARHMCTVATSDFHYVETVREYLTDAGMVLLPGPSQPSEAYVKARAMMRQGTVRIPRHERLLRQLRDTQGRPTSGGGLSIQHPRTANGGHGDIVAAFVLALWQLSGDEIPKPKPVPGSREAEELRKAARAQSYRDEAERPRWLAKGGGAGYDAKHGGRGR